MLFFQVVDEEDADPEDDAVEDPYCGGKAWSLNTEDAQCGTDPPFDTVTVWGWCRGGTEYGRV